MNLIRENFESETCLFVNDFKNKPVSVINKEILNVQFSCNKTKHGLVISLIYSFIKKMYWTIKKLNIQQLVLVLLEE